MTAAANLVAARLDRLPFSRTLWRLVLLVSLGGAFELYDIFLTAYIAPGLRREGVDPGFFIFCTFMGMLVGCIGFGSIADRLGRRAIFISSLLWYSAATAIMAFQRSAVGIDVWRFVASVGIGLEQVTIDAYIPEFVPPSGRGRAFAFYQFIGFTSVPVVALCGWLLVPRAPLGLAGWRWVSLIGAAGALIAWALRQGLPESPRWLAIHGRVDEAERVLEQLEAAVIRDTGQLLPAPASAPVAPESRSSGFREIFRPPYRSRTLLLSVFNLLQTVGFYGFGNWVPTLLVGRGIHLTASLEYAFIIAIANPVGPLLGMLVADRMERKWQIVSAGAGVGVFMFLFARENAPALLIALGVMVTLSNNWMSFAFHNYQAELFPTRIRSRAVGFVYAWSRVSAAFAGPAIAFFLATGGTRAVALFIGAAMILMVITIGAFGPPTRNRTLEEISD